MVNLIPFPSESSADLNEDRCIVVDKDGMAQFMVLTQDGRWVPAEEY